MIEYVYLRVCDGGEYLCGYWMGIYVEFGMY